jgi:hypothetical protein
MRKAKRDKKLADDARLLRAWKQYHREQLGAALHGMHADVMGRLMAELKSLCSARELVAAIEAMDWSVVDAETRMTALHEINSAITALRVRADPLTPISDPLPGQPLNAFKLIKRIINPNSA